MRATIPFLSRCCYAQIQRICPALNLTLPAYMNIGLPAMPLRSLMNEVPTLTALPHHLPSKKQLKPQFRL